MNDNDLKISGGNARIRGLDIELYGSDHKTHAGELTIRTGVSEKDVLFTRRPDGTLEFYDGTIIYPDGTFFIPKKGAAWMKPKTKILISIIAMALLLVLILAFEEGYIQVTGHPTKFRMPE